jgi:hypothetical protein
MKRQCGEADEQQHETDAQPQLGLFRPAELHKGGHRPSMAHGAPRLDLPAPAQIAGWVRGSS